MQSARHDAGAIGSGVLIAVLILALLAVGAFFVLGGKANVDVNKPKVNVSTSPAPNPT